jgi:hypothetical protein
MKGQMFSLDALLALVAVTVVLGYITIQFENVYSQSHDLEYQKLQSLADDISQITAKASQTGNLQDNPNVVDDGSLNRIEKVFDISPYFYEIILSGSSSASLNEGACSGKSNIAVSRRVITTGTLTVKVCK